jgi:SH3 domain protein
MLNYYYFPTFATGVMGMEKKIFYFFVLFFFWMPCFASAETMYINDNLEVMVRGGKGIEFKILAIKKAHEPLEVLKTEDDYCFVRTENGIEGWVLRRYLTREIPAPLVVEKLRTEIEQMKEQQAALSQEHQKALGQKKNTEEAAVRLGEQAKTLETRYQELKATSANVIAIKKEHDRLLEENRSHALTITRLTDKNKQLQDYAMLLWFVAGATTLLIGILFGALFQGLRSRRKKSLSF